MVCEQFYHTLQIWSTLIFYFSFRYLGSVYSIKNYSIWACWMRDDYSQLGLWRTSWAIIRYPTPARGVIVVFTSEPCQECISYDRRPPHGRIHPSYKLILYLSGQHSHHWTICLCRISRTSPSVAEVFLGQSTVHGLVMAKDNLNR